MEKLTSPDSPTDNFNLTQDKESDEKAARRDALRRIGKYSAYAVPALLALSAKAGPTSQP
tara:strand:+ start:498 stop:677 length:180 start_codon:yes stop_codon:yes gene_type:complete